MRSFRKITYGEFSEFVQEKKITYNLHNMLVSMCNLLNLQLRTVLLISLLVRPAYYSTQAKEALEKITFIIIHLVEKFIKIPV